MIQMAWVGIGHRGEPEVAADSKTGEQEAAVRQPRDQGCRVYPARRQRIGLGDVQEEGARWLDTIIA